ncbi:hypothetical protein HMPREF9189_1035 [Streptococcus sp. oral taxon 071 str. 73H25AP]|jgi:hypothetical protein|nr:hypothetical protein HMPREF9189_1035 [Streptococcus sp. oral taxon 071 str. 73H25AP]ORO42511.1 hypothetical protein B7726_05840 [Streptococcus oralis subsp. tigurinus]
MASYRKRENGKYKKAEKGGFLTKKLPRLQKLSERKNYYSPLMFQTTLLFTTTLNNGQPFIRNLIFLP